MTLAASIRRTQACGLAVAGLLIEGEQAADRCGKLLAVVVEMLASVKLIDMLVNGAPAGSE